MHAYLYTLSTIDELFVGQLSIYIYTIWDNLSAQIGIAKGGICYNKGAER